MGAVPFSRNFILRPLWSSLALKLTVKATLMLERLVKRMALAARSFPPSPAAYAGIHAPVLDFPSYCKVSGSQIPGLEGA